MRSLIPSFQKRVPSPSACGGRGPGEGVVAARKSLVRQRVIRPKNDTSGTRRPRPLDRPSSLALLPSSWGEGDVFWPPKTEHHTYPFQILVRSLIPSFQKRVPSPSACGGRGPGEGVVAARKSLVRQRVIRPKNDTSGTRRPRPLDCPSPLALSPVPGARGDVLSPPFDGD